MNGGERVKEGRLGEGRVVDVNGRASGEGAVGGDRE